MIPRSYFFVLLQGLCTLWGLRLHSVFWRNASFVTEITCIICLLCIIWTRGPVGGHPLFRGMGSDGSQRHIKKLGVWYTNAFFPLDPILGVDASRVIYTLCFNKQPIFANIFWILTQSSSNVLTPVFCFFPLWYTDFFGPILRKYSREIFSFYRYETTNLLIKGNKFNSHILLVFSPVQLILCLKSHNLRYTH